MDNASIHAVYHVSSGINDFFGVSREKLDLGRARAAMGTYGEESSSQRNSSRLE